MNPIVNCNVHQDSYLASFSSRSSSGNEPPFSWPFQQGSYQGVLLIDQIKQIQAYLKNERGALVPAQFVSPFANLFFTTKKQLETFGSTLPNYYVRVAPLEDGDFKVYLHPKMAGGTLTEMQEAELKEADRLNELGKNLQEEAKFDEALDHFERSLKIFERLTPKNPAVAVVKSNIGSLFEDQGLQAKEQGKLDEALGFFKKSLEIRLRLDPHSREVDSSHYRLSNVFKEQSNFKDALKHCKESLQILKHFPSDFRRRCTSHSQIGFVYWKLRDFTYSLGHFQTSLTLSKLADLNSSELGQIYMNIAWSYKDLADFGNAQTYFKVSLELFRKHDTSSHWESIVCAQLSGLYAHEGKIEEALGYGQQALAKDIEINADNPTPKRQVRLAHLHANVGMLCVWQSDDTLAAKDHLNKSLIILKRIKPNSIDEAGILFKIAKLHLWRAKPLEALPYLEEILTIRKAYDSKKSAVQKSDNSHRLKTGKICEYILEQDNPHIEFMEAFFHLYGDFQIGQKIDLYSPVRAQCYCEMAELSFFCGKFAEALSDFETAYSIWKQKLSDRHTTISYAGIMIAQAAFKLGDYKKAFKYATITKNNDPSYKYAYITLGLIFKIQGKLKEALTEFDRARKCDPGCSDATIYRLEVLLELYRLEVLADPEKKGKDTKGIAASITQARQLPPTSYVVQKKGKIIFREDAIAEATDEKGIRRLPRAVYKSNSLEYHVKIYEFGKEFVSLFSPLNKNNNNQASPASRVEVSSSSPQMAVQKLNDKVDPTPQSSSQNRRPDLRVDANLDTV